MYLPQASRASGIPFRPKPILAWPEAKSNISDGNSIIPASLASLSQYAKVLSSMFSFINAVDPATGLEKSMKLLWAFTNEENNSIFLLNAF